MSAPDISDGTADHQIASYVDRILRLKEEADGIASDIREIYAEARSNGLDKTALGTLVAELRKLAKVGADAIDERDTILDLYRQAYHRGSSHTHAREAA